MPRSGPRFTEEEGIVANCIDLFASILPEICACSDLLVRSHGPRCCAIWVTARRVETQRPPYVVRSVVGYPDRPLRSSMQVLMERIRTSRRGPSARFSLHASAVFAASNLKQRVCTQRGSSRRTASFAAREKRGEDMLDVFDPRSHERHSGTTIVLRTFGSSARIVRQRSTLIVAAERASPPAASKLRSTVEGCSGRNTAPTLLLSHTCGCQWERPGAQR